MSAPPVVEPAPGIGETPPAGAGPADDVAEEPPERRRRRRLLLFFLMLLALLLLLGLAIWYLLFRQPIPIPTVPGETIMPGYVTSIYGVSRPTGVTVTEAGDRVYIGETAGEQTARMFDGLGNQLGQLLPPLSTGSDHVPTYAARNPQTGEVYVSDRLAAAIYIYDAQGTYQRAVTPPTDVVAWQPLGMTFDAAGNLYVTDVGELPHRIRVIDPSGRQIRVLGLEDGLNFPNGVAVDGNGNVYVTDGNNGRLLVFGQDGGIVARVARGQGAGNLGLPRGVAVDGQGRVYVVDASGHMVLVYGQYEEGTSRLEYLGSFGSQGVGDGQFSYPNGIAVDGRGRLYVADSMNDRVQLWSY